MDRRRRCRQQTESDECAGSPPHTVHQAAIVPGEALPRLWERRDGRVLDAQSGYGPQAADEFVTADYILEMVYTRSLGALTPPDTRNTRFGCFCNTLAAASRWHRSCCC